MSNKNSESVKLLIEAEYLADDEFNKATKGVRDLAKESEKTDKALNQLKIDQATIASYRELSIEVNDLKEDIKTATLAEKEAGKEHGKSSKEYQKLSRAVNVLKQDLASNTTTFNKQKTALKDYNVTSKNVEQTVKDLNVKIEESALSSKKQVTALKEASAELERATVKQRSLATEKARQLQIEKETQASLEKTAKKAKEEAQAWDELQETIRETTSTRKKELDVLEKSHRKTIEEEKALTKTKNALKEYEQKLSQLNEERREGYLTQGDWIRAEDKLREQLKLTTSQINTHKKALKADEDALDKLNKKLEKAGQISREYRNELAQLNRKRKDGKITVQQLAEGEHQLSKKYKDSTKSANENSKAVARNSKTLKSAKSSTDALTKTTRRLAQAYTLLLAGSKAVEAIGSSVVQFGAVEAGMTKVEKTTGLARDKVEDLKNELNDMAVNITPTATKELLGYAEVAGQLGVTSKQGILDLVVASDALQSSTNLAGEEAVTLLTRMLMMSGEGVEGIHNLSSAVVELGNSTATSEDQIVHMGKEILTAGASIGLSTDQAVAWGATLKEAGQTAERSRTSIQRLALMIKKASVEGGEDLLKLSKITGLTGEAIQKGLGEEPEKILLSFVEGLNRIKEEGGVVATALEDMGIKSLESQAVLEKLGDVSLRLAENMNTASEAYIAQDRHLIEASKAYSDQDTAIAKVVNRLKLLQERLGEAFSGETNSSIKVATGLIEEYEESIVNLGEITADTLKGVIEFIEPFEEVFDNTGIVLDKLGNAITIVFNLIQSGVDAIIIAIQKWAQAWGWLTGQSEEHMRGLAEGIENSKERILRNNKDISDASALMFNETSRAYLGLRDVIVENEEAVASLTERQRLELKGMMRNGAFREQDNKRYRELTDIIVRQSRAVGTAEEQAKQIARDSKARADEKLESDRLQAESLQKTTELTEELFHRQRSLAEYTSLLGQSLKDGSISQQEYNEKFQVAKDLMKVNTDQTVALAEAQNNLNQKKIDELELVTSFVALTKDETEASTKLIESIQKKEAEIKKLEIAQVGLNKGNEAYIALQAEITDLTTDAITQLKELNELRELEDLTLSQVLEVQEKHIAKLAELKQLRDEDKLTIQEYNEEVEKLSTVTEFLNSNLSDVIATQQEKAKADEKAIENAEKTAKAKEKEAEASAKTAEQNKYEAKTVKELIDIKIDHDKALDSLLLQYENGEITWAKYQLELEKMSVVTDILSKALANNTDEVAKNIVQLDEQVKAMSRNEKIAEKFSKRTEQRSLRQASMLTASSSGFDATTASASELGEEIETLEGRIYQNAKVMRSSWFYELASSQRALDETSLATAKQAKAVLQLQNSYENLENPTLTATKAIARSIDAMGDLDDATLDSLRSEVNDTISAFDDLRETINDSLDSVEDRLSALKGEEQAIQDRAHKKEIEDAEKLRDSATGNDKAVKEANELIKKLKEAHKIEKGNLKREIAEDKAEAEQDAKDDAEYNQTKATKRSVTNDSVASTIASKSTQAIVINLGSKSTELTGNKDDIMSLLTDMGYTIS